MIQNWKQFNEAVSPEHESMSHYFMDLTDEGFEIEIKSKKSPGDTNTVFSITLNSELYFYSKELGWPLYRKLISLVYNEIETIYKRLNDDGIRVNHCDIRPVFFYQKDITSKYPDAKILSFNDAMQEPIWKYEILQRDGKLFTFTIKNDNMDIIRERGIYDAWFANTRSTLHENGYQYILQRVNFRIEMFILTKSKLVTEKIDFDKIDEMSMRHTFNSLTDLGFSYNVSDVEGTSRSTNPKINLRYELQELGNDYCCPYRTLDFLNKIDDGFRIITLQMFFHEDDLLKNGPSDPFYIAPKDPNAKNLFLRDRISDKGIKIEEEISEAIKEVNQLVEGYLNYNFVNNVYQTIYTDGQRWITINYCLFKDEVPEHIQIFDELVLYPEYPVDMELPSGTII